MNLTNRLDARLEPDEYERFQEGHPIQIPTGNRLIVLYPPAEPDENQQGESETIDAVGNGDTVDELGAEQ